MRARNTASMVGWVSCTLLAVSMAAAQGGPGTRPTPLPAASQASSSDPIPLLPTPGAATQPLPATSATPPLPPPTTGAQPAPGATPSGAPTAAGAPSAPVLWPAPAATSEAQAAPPSRPWTHRDLSKDFWQIGLGLRVSWVKDQGLDPYASSDSLTHGSVFATRALVLSPRFSVAGGLSFESGGRSSTARSAPSSLTVIRPGAVLEGRYHIDRDLYVGIRLVPQAVYSHISIDDPSSPTSLKQADWRFGLDATGLAAWNFVRMMGAGPTVPEWWLLAEFGYGFTQSKDVVLKPDVSDSDPRAGDRLSMGKLGMSGVMMRVAVAVTF